MNSNSDNTVTVVDLSCVVYNIYHLVTKSDVTGEDIRTVADHTLKLLLAGFNTPNRNFIFVVDSKISGTYWRTSIVRQTVKCPYKGGRKKKGAEWFVIMDTILSRANQLGIPVLNFPGFEADDLAALITVASDHNPVDLFTVDTDWLGLVRSEDTMAGYEPGSVFYGPAVRWLNIGPWAPRLRDSLDSIREWSKSKISIDINHPKDIWYAKSVLGDQSDGLPPGTPLNLISLLEPLEGYRLWEHPSVLRLAKRAIERATQVEPLSNDDCFESIATLQQVGGLPLSKWSD